MKGTRVFLPALGVVSALGRDKAEVMDNLMNARRPGIVDRHDLMVDGSSVVVGAVAGVLPDVPERLSVYASRNSQLIIAATEQIRDDIEAARERFGPSRIAVVLGTSTSGIAEGERAVRFARAEGRLPLGFDIRQQEMGSASEMLARYLRLEGLAYTISTACSSSAIALAAGRRLLSTGLADAVLAGGADSLCRLTINGFHALSILSKSVCNPFSRNRDGTTIGEGAALFLMQRDEAEVALVGTGASTDAYSMTAPEPDGRGVEVAMRQALEDAGLAPADIDYVQLHGTGTIQNDPMESKAMQRVFDAVPCSSSKGQLGHTLGAAGAMGAAHCWLAASGMNEERYLPPHVWDGDAEEGLLHETLVRPRQRAGPNGRRILMSNAFAFGGNNMSLILAAS